MVVSGDAVEMRASRSEAFRREFSSALGRTLWV